MDDVTDQELETWWTRVMELEPSTAWKSVQAFIVALRDGYDRLIAGIDRSIHVIACEPKPCDDLSRRLAQVYSLFLKGGKQ